jgi:hypothetical protein
VVGPWAAASPTTAVVETAAVDVDEVEDVVAETPTHQKI